jgi:hypothetical protein
VLIEAGKYIVEVQASPTKRAARAAYLELHDWLPVDPGRVDARPGDEVVASRIERNRVVEEWRIRIPGEPGPDAGVREPRRRRPPGGAAAAAVELP